MTCSDESSLRLINLDDHLPASLSEELLGATRSLSISAASLDPARVPSVPPRYKLLELLGEGGYGRVFRAFDRQLHRHVAIKIPHVYRTVSASETDRQLIEARTLAQLSHPSVVSIFDVFQNEEDLPCIVSAFVDGASLAERMRNDPLTLREALVVLMDIGKALGYIHSRGIVHRDVKPGNILLSKDGNHFLVDFGLALRNDDVVFSGKRVGTVAYMSPEQARGENHLVDGRSDLFSLGVILYHMLTGQRPFGGDDRESMISHLISDEPIPPTTWVPTIPQEIERVCLKAIAKRASDRYGNADQLIDDLNRILERLEESAEDEPAQWQPDAKSRSRISGVVPRGLRSFGRHDASFFQRLLPGPWDLQGVPESLRFWQRRITEIDDADPPSVGVLYGPSGCGKSSFVKAGLLPLLGDSVTPIFIEATHEDTEFRLLREIQKRWPDIPRNCTLADAIRYVRQSESDSPRPKLLLIIDQFEQWLHARDESQNQTLAMALRQCDGHHVQCLLLVRDDFWLALSRFMSVTEIPLRQNSNAALVDLFSPAHARYVLAELGAAYDRIAADPASRTAEQDDFLNRAVASLTHNGRVFPVQLSLFVEMSKNQPWQSKTLDRLGGFEGIGRMFLEESFSSELAPAAQRTHEPAARGVLQRLLPEPQVDIKGQMQPEAALLEASGYQSHPQQFRELIRILDKELRLISPTDPSGTVSDEDSLSQSGDSVPHYQLTHDYLVPSIGRWLTERQQSTRRGRAELRLAEYAALWKVKANKRYLPGIIDWLSIWMLSPRSRWNQTEQRLMREATWRHLRRSVSITTFLLIGGFLAMTLRERQQANVAVSHLQTVRVDELPPQLDHIHGLGNAALAPLSLALKSATGDAHLETINRLGLLATDPSQRSPLIMQADQLDLPLLMLVREELGVLLPPERQRLLERLNDTGVPAANRLRTAILLGSALGGKERPDLQPLADDVPSMLADELLRHASNAPQDNRYLIDGLLPLRDVLIPELRSKALRDEDTPERSQSTAFTIQFLRNEPKQLLDFFLDASLEQHPVILATLGRQLGEVKADLQQLAANELNPNVSPDAFDQAARRRGVAAALLHRMGQPEVTWPLLRHSSHPNARAYLINRVAALGGDANTLLVRFSREPDPSIRRALLLALGRFDRSSLSEAIRSQVMLIAKDCFQNDPDVGTHSAALWLLCQWGERDWVQKKTDSWATLPIDPRKDWFVNSEGQTMAILDGREDPDVARVFAISIGEVTVAQYQRHASNAGYYEYRSPTPDCPMGMLTWDDCASYCNWLTDQTRGNPDVSYAEDSAGGLPNAHDQNVLEGEAYRLPTAAEWRFACAAMTVTRRFYGHSDALADDYFFYYETSRTPDRQNRYHPIGSKMPNDLGMFSMYDGVREWCHDLKEDRRIIMGGSSNGNIYAADSQLGRPIIEMPSDLPLARNGYYGFRVAKTIQR